MAKKGKKPVKTAPTHRIHLYFSGRVQGVGFRYTTEEIALSMGVHGWVKNLPDTRVEVVAEGDKPMLETFLERIRGCSLGPHIKKVDCAWEKPTGEFSDFCVEFCF